MGRILVVTTLEKNNVDKQSTTDSFFLVHVHVFSLFFNISLLADIFENWYTLQVVYNHSSIHPRQIEQKND